ncbi:MAG: NAD(P)-dependent oxidoreductase [Vicingus serpentipes]|nr:NAD(P)-dependent oxidoreductase [Vicingus serpentipes]
MKKAIVFGSNGYLGRHITFFLNENNFEVLPLSNSPYSIDDYLNYQQVDISKSKEVDNINFDVDYIFAFAGLTGTNVSFDRYEQFIKVNEIGLLNILNHHKNSNSKARIIYPSTRLVYKGMKNKFLDEEAEKETKTIYAQNKLAGERYLKIYHNYYGIDYTVFRIGVPYGNLFDSNYSYGTLNFLFNKAKNKESVLLYGDGSQKRTFTHVYDIAQLIIQSISSEKTKNSIYNIGSNDNLSLLEVATMISEKYSVEIEYIQWPEEELKIESGDTVFCDKKIKKEIHYQYKHNIKEWLKEV